MAGIRLHGGVQQHALGPGQVAVPQRAHGLQQQFAVLGTGEVGGMETTKQLDGATSTDLTASSELRVNGLMRYKNILTLTSHMPLASPHCSVISQCYAHSEAGLTRT